MGSGLLLETQDESTGAVCQARGGISHVRFDCQSRLVYSSSSPACMTEACVIFITIPSRFHGLRHLALLFMLGRSIMLGCTGGPLRLCALNVLWNPRRFRNIPHTRVCTRTCTLHVFIFPCSDMYAYRGWWHDIAGSK